MLGTPKDLAWNLFVELRKELVEMQKLRAQVTGFKITFVSAGTALIVANIEKVPVILLVVPAVAAVFFDSLISSYAFSIKRTGFYCRKYLEPVVKKECDGWPVEVPLWEEFMQTPEARQNLSLVGNLGLTALAVVAAAITLFMPFVILTSIPLLFLLVALSVYDLLNFWQPSKHFISLADGSRP